MSAFIVNVEYIRMLCGDNKKMILLKKLNPSVFKQDSRYFDLLPLRRSNTFQASLCRPPQKHFQTGSLVLLFCIEGGTAAPAISAFCIFQRFKKLKKVNVKPRSPASSSIIALQTFILFKDDNKRLDPHWQARTQSAMCLRGNDLVDPLVSNRTIFFCYLCFCHSAVSRHHSAQRLN